MRGLDPLSKLSLRTTIKLKTMLPEGMLQADEEREKEKELERLR